MLKGHIKLSESQSASASSKSIRQQIVDTGKRWQTMLSMNMYLLPNGSILFVDLTKLSLYRANFSSDEDQITFELLRSLKIKEIPRHFVFSDNKVIFNDMTRNVYIWDTSVPTKDDTIRCLDERCSTMMTIKDRSNGHPYLLTSCDSRNTLELWSLESHTRITMVFPVAKVDKFYPAPNGGFGYVNNNSKLQCLAIDNGVLIDEGIICSNFRFTKRIIWFGDKRIAISRKFAHLKLHLFSDNSETIKDYTHDDQNIIRDIKAISNSPYIFCLRLHNLELWELIDDALVRQNSIDCEDERTAANFIVLPNGNAVVVLSLPSSILDCHHDYVLQSYSFPEIAGHKQMFDAVSEVFTTTNPLPLNVPQLVLGYAAQSIAFFKSPAPQVKPAGEETAQLVR